MEEVYQVTTQKSFDTAVAALQDQIQTNEL